MARQAPYMLTWVPSDELAVFGQFQVVDTWERRVVLPPTPIQVSIAIVGWGALNCNPDAVRRP
ncbi:MAG: hypothetical protein ACREHD_11925 [Pirellulales bacterium]